MGMGQEGRGVRLGEAGGSTYRLCSASSGDVGQL